VVVLGLGGVLGYRALTAPPGPTGPPCGATVAGTTYGLSFDQAANATTIAAVGKRLGLPDHAVTVALATALQESRLHNLSSGDRDSLGLFQQRPSQGWGTAAQIMSPPDAAAAFYRRLARVPSWAARPVTEVAQAVQRSAAPDGYADWEAEARVLAQALTGEAPGAFSCRGRIRPALPPPATMAAAIGAEVGPAAVDAVQPSSSQGWLLATWLVGHAERYGIASVSFAGQRWTATSGRWVPQPPGDLRLTVNA
jgi:hypothetical protein